MYRQQALVAAALLGVGLVYWWQTQRKKSGTDGEAQNVPILATYTRDLTNDVKSLDPVFGREAEIERVMHILARRAKNNPLLIGEPGVGKTAVVEGIAHKLAAGDVPNIIKGKRVLALDLGALIGGTKYRGEFEERMKKLTQEIAAASRQVILFIDEVHMVVQSKGAEGAINVSDILKPALARGDLQMIGATTWREYEQYIKPDHALNRRLQPVIVGEPSSAASLQILRGLKAVYEAHHGVLYTDEALKSAVNLSRQFIKERFLPDKAIDLIDEAGAKVAIEASRESRHAMGVLHAAGASAAEKIRALRAEEERLQTELEHLRALEARLPKEVELVEIRERMEQLLASCQKVEKRVAAKMQNGVPQVTTRDVQAIVKDWLGPRKQKTRQYS